MFNAPDRNEFLSEEDLDIGNLSWPELLVVWNAWFMQAQSTNDEDQDDYSHGVFLSEKQKREIWGDDWQNELATENTENAQKNTERDKESKISQDVL